MEISEIEHKIMQNEINAAGVLTQMKQHVGAKAHFNQLTPAEHERLSILFEECSETIHIIGKIMRHGFESRHPDGNKTNRQLLEKELGHVKYASFLMSHNEDIDEERVNDSMKLKNLKIGKYLHHQDDQIS